MIGGRYVPYVLGAIALQSEAPRLIDDVQSVRLADLNHATLSDLKSRLSGVEGNVGLLRFLLANDLLPVVGRDLDVTRDALVQAGNLLAAADDLSTAGAIALDLGDRLVAIRDSSRPSGQSVMPELVNLLGSSAPQIDQAVQSVADARGLVSTIPDDAPLGIGRIAGRVRGALDQYAPLLDQFQVATRFLPRILGWHGSARYLVLAQDPAELRPTGGYIGTVGTLGFTDGALTERSFQDVYHFDLRTGIPFVEPPEPLANHLLGASSWQLADANWSPDFPTTARDALRLYTLESGDSKLDGVIGLTTYAIDSLLTVTGPVEVPDYGVTVSAGEVTLTALRLTRGTSTLTSDRKAFLDELATNVLDRLFSLPSDRWPAALDAFVEMANQRLIQTWFSDPEVESVVGGAEIGGAVRQDTGDYVYVVEANVAPTSKFNLVVKRHDTLEVEIGPTGDATANLRLDWQNDAMAPGEPYASIRSYSTSSSGIYGAYVRVLTPLSTQLLSTDGNALDPIDLVENSTTEAGRNSYGNYLLMAPGPASLTYRWTTTGVATQADGVWTYRLTVQKQPGLTPVPLSLKVVLPAGARIVSVSPGAAASDGSVTYAASLNEDAQIEIHYQLP